MTDQSYWIIPIIKENNEFKILVLKHLKWHWGLPKWHPEWNESPIETAIREFNEETGLFKLDLFNWISFNQIYPIVLNWKNIDKKVTYFPAFIDKNEKINLEKQKLDFNYFNIDDIANKLNIPKESQQIIRDIKEFLQTLN